MLYYLFQFLDQLNVPGAGVFEYISFRAGMAVIVSLFIASVYGKRLIRFLQKKQIGETIRDLELEGQFEKRGTPTMGGVIIIASVVVPTLLFAQLHNIYVILMLITTLWLGAVGFMDDYIKTFKQDKKGLSGKFKIFGQISLGLIIGFTFYFSEDIVIRKNPASADQASIVSNQLSQGQQNQIEDIKSTKTTIPFFKRNEFDYKYLVAFLGEGSEKWAWVAFVLIVIFIITAVSNGANLTDGLDGLAAGSSSIMGVTLIVLAYVSGHIGFSKYLNIMYIPYVGELVIFGSAFIGATIGFLWYNSFPAQVFMGDTGSLTIGGIVATFAILIRKELLIPIMSGIFLIESLSVILQVSYFKYTKRKLGKGKRIFLMSPLHHHYQKKGYPEPKIVTRFWIVGIILAVLTIITLKIR